MLRLPDGPDTVGIQQRYTKGVSSLVPRKCFKKIGDLNTTSFPTNVSGQLFLCNIPSSDEFLILELRTSSVLAFFSKDRSSLLHSKMHWDRRAINVPHSGCESVVQPLTKRCMKCHRSRRMTNSFQAVNRELTFLSPQQSRSVYRRTGGETRASS